METVQLNLFMTGITCCYCLKDPGRNPQNGNLWNGILDKDTRQHVCWSCLKTTHYRLKWQTEFKGLYSEFPVMVNTNF